MSTPSSISRDNFSTTWSLQAFKDPTACSSLLGKRERGLGEDATIQPDAKRPAFRELSPNGPLDGRKSNVSTPRAGSTSSASDADELEGLEPDSKARPPK
ncbi:hypothetical protein EG329_005505, partial [Mollisiaceae sp. DMI_Dod_QoI]